MARGRTGRQRGAGTVTAVLQVSAGSDDAHSAERDRTAPPQWGKTAGTSGWTHVKQCAFRVAAATKPTARERAPVWDISILDRLRMMPQNYEGVVAAVNNAR